MGNRTIEELKAELLFFYYHSDSVHTGEFGHSLQRDRPKLEPIPVYLHYPEEGPQAECLPRLFEIAAQLMADYILKFNEDPWIEFDRIVGIPKGANPLAEALAKQFGRERDLLVFEKDSPGERESFKLVAGDFDPGDLVLIVDDHIAGGRNKLLMKRALDELELKVIDLFTVVDRRQGGQQNLAAKGIRLHSLLTLDEVIDYGVRNLLLEPSWAERSRRYVARNQFDLTGSG